MKTKKKNDLTDEEIEKLREIAIERWNKLWKLDNKLNYPERLSEFDVQFKIPLQIQECWHTLKQIEDVTKTRFSDLVGKEEIFGVKEA